jgi:hypothetical protein
VSTYSRTGAKMVRIVSNRLLFADFVPIRNLTHRCRPVASRGISTALDRPGTVDCRMARSNVPHGPRTQRPNIEHSFSPAVRRYERCPGDQPQALELTLQTEDPNRASRLGDADVLPAVGRFRVINIDTYDIPQRRTMPRRRLVMPVANDRRCGDRREAKPGVDGLLRLVLADDWQ